MVFESSVSCAGTFSTSTEALSFSCDFTPFISVFEPFWTLLVLAFGVATVLYVMFGVWKR